MGSNAKLVAALYRSFLRNSKILDASREFKAILPREVHWGAGKKCDFYTTNVSCVETIRREFREPKEPERLEKAIDDAITVNKAISERVHLLFKDDKDEELLAVKKPTDMITTTEKYEQEKRTRPPEEVKALEKALELIKGASTILANEQMEGPDRARIAKAYYRESINAFPTADAHAYLGWHYYLDGELEQAVAECERAIELDPTFGNAYNDLALIRVQQEQDDEAIELFTKAKVAARYDVRHFPSLNLAALHLEKDRIKPALHEYIEALHWMDEETATPIRNTVADMSTFIVTLEEKLRASA
ncbi:hypothetical protein Poli38472_003692 [Pythium oligandrum]|uniref:Tetratricopeptide repeat protein n=1 Tax=Pythium oligandrum TaxID=41045 RepID=A0A8K1FNJ2_PYTOL|nr:hypothetical protein Poli38472_003692 [Pythium oligandrum]|eukprot:TMW65927.1 hypothetical protein Poli38472_003692 [Pythium oligandrum]